jgi:hypothetical protein
VRDESADTLLLTSDATTEPRCQLESGLLGVPHHFQWRVQFRREPSEQWIDSGPYMQLLRPAARATTVVTWDDAGFRLYRVLVRDDAEGRLVAADAVLTRSYTLDWEIFDRTHPHRWRVQGMRDGAWVDIGPYRELRVPTSVSIAVTREPGRKRQRPGAARDDVLFLFTVDSETSIRRMRHPDPRRAVSELVLGDFGNGEQRGIGLHMDLAEECGLRCCFFVDILSEFQFGRAGMERTVQAILERGHEIQLHLHTHHLRYSADLSHREVAGSLQGTDAEQFRRALAVAVELFDARVGRPAVAYRSGAYNICDAFLDVLPEFGLAIDSSLHSLKNCKVSDWMRTRTQPFRVGDVLEIPVTWLLRQGATGTDWRPLAPSRTDHQEAVTGLSATGRDQPLTVNYVSHSYQLLEAHREEGPEVRDAWNAYLRSHQENARFGPNEDLSWVFFGPEIDRARVALLRETLTQLVARADVRGVTFQEIKDRYLTAWDERPHVAVDPVPHWDGSANDARPSSSRIYSRGLLEAAAEGRFGGFDEPSATASCDVPNLIEMGDLPWARSNVLVWAADPSLVKRSLAPDVGPVDQITDPPDSRDHETVFLRQEEFRDIRWGAVFCVDVLHRLSPSEVLDSLLWLAGHLKPDGRVLVSTPTFFAAEAGGGRVPGVPRSHVLFGGSIVDSLAGPESTATMALCATSYLMLFRRAGFKFVEVKRVLLDEDDPFLREHAGKLRFYSRREVRTIRLEAVLRPPSEAELSELRQLTIAT